MKFISNFDIYIKENYLKYFNVNDNKYWFEVRDPKNDKGYSVGWGVGNIEDDNFSKFDRTDRHEQFMIFSEIKKLFKEWFHRVKPDNFYFSVPGEKRLRIYMNYLEDIIGKDYTSEVVETEYKPFDRKETKVYYGVFKKSKVFELFTSPYGSIDSSFTKEEFEDIHDIFLSEVGDPNNMAHMIIDDDGNYDYDPSRSDNQYVIRHYRNIPINTMSNSVSSYLKIKNNIENNFKERLLQFGFILNEMSDYKGVNNSDIYYINLSITREDEDLHHYKYNAR